MKKRLEKITENEAESSERPRVFTSLHRDPKYRKANAEFLTRRLRLEFGKLTTARPLCKRASNIPSLPPIPSELQKYRQIKLRTNTTKSRKRSN